MKKTKLILFYIFTFGIGYLYIRNKAIKKASITNDELTVSTKFNFDINDLIKYLNGIENIESCSSTISSIKLNLKSNNNIDIESIKKLGCKGVMIGENSITCLFGDFSNELSKQINEKLSIDK